MRFVAIVNQYQVAQSFSFASHVQALGFLFWGYEDKHLLLFGIYDKLTDQATSYTHVGQSICSIWEKSIRRVALIHLTLTNQYIDHVPSAHQRLPTNEDGAWFIFLLDINIDPTNSNFFLPEVLDLDTQLSHRKQNKNGPVLKPNGG